MKSRLYIFDFCGTLFDSRTTVDYLDYLRRRAPAGYRRRFHGRWILASALRRARWLDPPGYMRMRIRALRGLSRAFLETEAERFVGEWLAGRRRSEIHERFEKCLDGGERVVLLSHTLESLLRAFAGKRPVERILGSRLEFDADGHCTGRYALQMKCKGKLQALREHYDADVVRSACAVTDDPEADRELLAAVASPVVVPPAVPPAPDRRAALELWMPGADYYLSRYAHPFERVAHLLKYWLPHALLLTLLAGTAAVPRFPALLAAWTAFLSLYDLFSRHNDECSAKRETAPVAREHAPQPRPVVYAAVKTGMALCAVCLMAALHPRPLTALWTILLLSAVSAVFAVHNRLPAGRRVPTYCLLYLSKGVLPLVAVWDLLGPAERTLYWLYTAGFNMSYAPQYALKKRRRAQAHRSGAAARTGQTFLLRPILLKNLFLAALSLADRRLLWVLIWIDLVTLAEYAAGRRT